MENVEQELNKVMPNIQKYAHSLTRNHDEANDLVQNALVMILRKHDRFQEGSNFKSWATTVVHNVWVNTIRHSVREAELIMFTDSSLPEYTSAPTQEIKLILKDVHRAINLLPLDVQRILELVARDGMSYDDIAAQENIPVGTVRSKLARGREKLRDYENTLYGKRR